MYEVEQMEAIREIVVLFFRRDEAALKRLLGKQPKYMDTRDNACLLYTSHTLGLLQI